MTTFYEQREEKLYIGEMTHCPFPLHVHEVVEVVALRQGSLTMEIGDRSYQLETGDIAVVFPLISHSYVTLSQDASGLLAIFPRDLITDCSAVFHTMVPVNPVLKASALDSNIRLALSQLESMPDAAASPFGAAYLHVLLAGLLRLIPLQALSEYEEPGLGYRIIHYTSTHACEEITLESAAHALGISVSHLSHFFSQKIHINFRRFINSLRIDKAMQLMRDPNMTLTTISGLCGYTNMRTFRRAFMQETGMLPSRKMSAVHTVTAAPLSDHAGAAEKP